MNAFFTKRLLFLCLLMPLLAGAATDRTDAFRESAWHGVIAPSDVEPRRADESTWHAFQRQLEVTARLRRDRGLQFWRTYPDDPRKFSWLLLTVHLAPQYPADLESFAARSALDRGKIGIRDGNAMSAWHQAYPALREEFWRSPHVSDSQRRFLHCGEIQAQLREAAESDDATISSSLLKALSDIGRYARAYPEPFSPEDRSQHYVLLELLLNSLREKSILAGCSSAVEAQIAQLDGSEGGDEVRHGWAQLQERLSYRPSSGPDDPWSRLPEFPHGQITNFEERLVFWHKYVVYAQSIREVGNAVWMRNSPAARAIDWYEATNLTHWANLANPGEAIWQLTDERQDEVRSDTEAIVEWRAQRKRIRDALLALPLGSDDRMRVVRSEILGRGNDLAGGYRAADAHAGAIEVVRDSLTFYLDLRKYIAGVRTLDAALRVAQTVGVGRSAIRTILANHLDGLPAEVEPRWKEFVEGEVRRLDAFIDRKPLDITLNRRDGTPFALESARGKLVLVDFWSTGCSACLTMMRKFAPVYRKYQNAGFEIVSVNLDSDPNQVENVARIEAEFSWTQVRGDYGAIMDRFSFIGVPQFMLLDRAGIPIAESTELQSARQLERIIRAQLPLVSPVLP